MTARRWISVTIGTAAVVCLIAIAINAYIDVYGLFRNTRGRQLVGVDDERTSKYLLSYRYIPENFDALLIGSSVTGNWDLAGIRGFRMYNASLSGGNVTEEQAIVNRVLQNGKIKLAICVVHPYMTESHGFQAVTMGSQEFWSALGSVKLLQTYWGRVRVATGHSRLEFGGNGTSYIVAPKVLNPHLSAMMQPGEEFTVDPIALQEYAAIVAGLRHHGAQIVVVLPPLYDGILRSKRSAFEHYYARVMPIFRSDDPVIDFNGPEFANFRANRENFADGVHLSGAGAREIVRLMNERLNDVDFGGTSQRRAAR